MDFWTNTQLLMDRKKIKQKDIANATGHSSGRVCDWINRKIVPKADDALKIADLLGVSVRFLVTGEDDRGISRREKELLDLCSVLRDDKFKLVLDMARLMRTAWEQEAAAGSYSPDSKEA